MKERLKTIITNLKKRHPLAFWFCAVIEGIALLLSLPQLTSGLNGFAFAFLLTQSLAATIILSFVNIHLIFIKPKNNTSWKKKVRTFEIFSVVLGSSLTVFFLSFFARAVDWHVQIAMGDKHSPIWLEAVPTVAILCLIAIIGYFILAYTKAKTTPPLVTVFAIAALYIGIFQCVMWSIQVYNESLFLIILPINCIIIAARLIREKALEFKEETETIDTNNNFIGWLNRLISSSFFPIWALVFVFPLLGAAIGLLVLFGQSPDYIIKSYTETADWTFSQQIAPPGYDAHYLCTVAAQGHKKLVKPQRYGIRRGQKIVVNRQLCIANAFEELLQEKLPKLHRVIRNFYDRHGYPLSKLITTPKTADFIYLLMKPLEWCFLVVLYLFTVNPEQRISRQYPL